MLESIKAKVEETKTFVKKHQTATACVATGIVTYTLTKEYHLAVGKKLAYQWGKEYGVLEVRDAVLRQYISDKGLVEEFLMEYVPSLA